VKRTTLNSSKTPSDRISEGQQWHFIPNTLCTN